MSDAITRLMTLEAQGAWSTICSSAVDLLTSCDDDNEKARVHASLSVAYQNVSRGPNDWRLARQHAVSVSTLMPKDSWLYAWSLNQIAGVSADMGRLVDAERYARAFLRIVDSFEGKTTHKAMAYRTLSYVAYRRGAYRKALSLRLIAYSLFSSVGEWTLAERLRLNIAWCYIRMGRPVEANAWLTGVSSVNDHLVSGALAAIAYLDGDYNETVRLANEALSVHRLAYDQLDAAEVSLFRSYALRQLGRLTDAHEAFETAVKLAARQMTDVHTLLVLDLRQKGGHKTYAQAYRGSADPHHGSCFTSGVA